MRDQGSQSGLNEGPNGTQGRQRRLFSAINRTTHDLYTFSVTQTHALQQFGTYEDVQGSSSQGITSAKVYGALSGYQFICKLRYIVARHVGKSARSKSRLSSTQNSAGVKCRCQE